MICGSSAFIESTQSTVARKAAGFLRKKSRHFPVLGSELISSELVIPIGTVQLMGGESMHHLLILGDAYRQFRTEAARTVAFFSMLLILAGCGGGGGGENVGPEPTLAGFTTSVTEGDYDLTVQFTDTSTGAVESYLWDFGDGNGSTEASPSHT